METGLKNAVEGVRAQLYPFTIKHLLYFVVISGLTALISEHFFKFKLIKWIYVGTMIILAANLYKGGNTKQAAADIFRVATI